MRRNKTVSAVTGDAGPDGARLLRELHDAIGPALTGMAFGLRAARNLVGRDPESAARLLAQLEEELHGAICDLRGLTDGAPPDVLDRVGLVEAIRRHALALSGHVSGSGTPLSIDVQARGNMTVLTLPVQVATYRVVCEALSNMARHSRARTCVVLIRTDDERDGELNVEVVDDGIGVPWRDADPWRGVGLTSMRTRVTELGGQWSIEPGVPVGTRVVATFPLGSG
ncbi:Histidine kinase-, DNA gyrase B-, and HSP90-like ATPase [Actinokineospora terrae]|uniref:Histidine kinase-, DNA gyrase B-, and HSP90-like ATPase n=1 Tax=Actinokineospora terrae TaxID=155974 RepID=A0A1H9KQ99_9PSEU|nr:Histidine kinase-, DNA gyrase B-, and HSP90-like ATPase [Actinokineospora terrae]